ncbi:palmitoyl-protein thioesterase 1 [Rhizodiscina lignyota]|uniref:Palmitoyl-protein thioesterase 1 n=1 Tax=Rhizodiscina lignyota TaxID=1504668 RepID=A0A9P4M8I1_9PEZI|nr:palmitoyl-protein thioesterase 1 [Rhizodiscina lignyota]
MYSLWSTASALIFAALASSVLSHPSIESTQLPLLIWHGLGDRFDADGIKAVATLAEKINPGTYVYPIHLSDDGGSDRTATFYGNVTEQVQQVCEDIAAHPVLSTAPALNALGFSQGGLFLRVYAQRCNSTPLWNLVTYGSPHNGISDFTGCKAGDWLCKGAMTLLRSNAWSSLAQSRLVPAQYYREINDTTLEPTDDYLEYSNLLADVNNERELKNMTYAERLAALNKLVMIEFADDTTVIPKESQWFSEVNGTSKEITPLRERSIYKEDWIGLKKLDEKEGLEFRKTPGDHMQIGEGELNKTFEEWFGPIKKYGTLTLQDSQSKGSLEL